MIHSFSCQWEKNLFNLLLGRTQAAWGFISANTVILSSYKINMLFSDIHKQGSSYIDNMQYLCSLFLDLHSDKYMLILFMRHLMSKEIKQFFYVAEYIKQNKVIRVWNRHLLYSLCFYFLYHSEMFEESDLLSRCESDEKSYITHILLHQIWSHGQQRQ